MFRRDKIALKSSFERVGCIQLNDLSDVYNIGKIQAEVNRKNVTGIEIKALNNSFEIES